MKWAYYVKYKVKAVVVLLIILAVVLLNHFWERRNFSLLDKSVSSIYNDRLLPATYLFQLSDHLYKKRLLLHSGNNAVVEQKKHNAAIDALIGSYEKTYLTDAERHQWVDFKQHLQAYYALETKGEGNHLEMQLQFEQTLAYLNQLSDTQAKEGNQLQKTSQGIVSGSAVSSQLEISMLIILGLFAMILLSATDVKVFSQSQQKHLLN